MLHVRYDKYPEVPWLNRDNTLVYYPGYVMFDREYIKGFSEAIQDTEVGGAAYFPEGDPPNNEFSFNRGYREGLKDVEKWGINSAKAYLEFLQNNETIN